MSRLAFSRIFQFFCLLLLSPTLVPADQIQEIHPTGYVTDLASVLSEAERARLEALCSELEQKTGAQMAVVTVQSLEGESIEQYSVDLFKHLGIGSKKDNRGVLLLLAPTERKYRIEVGYGLEPIINDARAGDAGRAMVPYLRQGDYNSAVETAAWQLAKYIADDRGVDLAQAREIDQSFNENLSLVQKAEAAHAKTVLDVAAADADLGSEQPTICRDDADRRRSGRQPE